jgi:hypothetical protein
MDAIARSKRATALLERLSKLSVVFGPLISSNLATLFRLVPSLLKYLVYLVLLLNARSLPFGWHGAFVV